MGYDSRKELAKFKREWAWQEKILREKGFDNKDKKTEDDTEKAIAELYDFSFEQFKADRNYALKICAFTSVNNDDLAANGKKVRKGMVEQPQEFDECFELRSQIKNPTLLKALEALKDSDYELLCLAVAQDLTEKEIALRYGQTQQNISRKIRRIKKFLKNFF